MRNNPKVPSLNETVSALSAQSLADTSGTALVEKKPASNGVVDHPTPVRSYSPVPQTPPADSNKVAFDIGGSAETDLDSKEFDTKDLDCNHGQPLDVIHN